MSDATFVCPECGQEIKREYQKTESQNISDKTAEDIKKQEKEIVRDWTRLKTLFTEIEAESIDALVAELEGPSGLLNELFDNIRAHQRDIWILETRRHLENAVKLGLNFTKATIEGCEFWITINDKITTDHEKRRVDDIPF